MAHLKKNVYLRYSNRLRKGKLKNTELDRQQNVDSKTGLNCSYDFQNRRPLFRQSWIDAIRTRRSS